MTTRTTAIHESGHTVVAHALGLRLGRTILADDDGNGRSETWGDGGIKSLLVSMAGRAAEIEFFDEVAEPYSCAADDAAIIKQLARLGFTDADTVAFIWHNALNLVAKNRADIERVATHLVHFKTLTADDVDALLGGNNMMPGASAHGGSRSRRRRRSN
jgi:ATP-dependent Zn protease